QGKSPGIFQPITPISGTFWKPKSLKVLPNKVFTFIEQALIMAVILKNVNWRQFLLLTDW
ncbi:MAG: hypothetical protein PX634_01475, partial [Microcystis sp. M53600_WE12]|nr:hypothetical protein [Microcystis sp. M53600_WE12]